MAAGNALQMVLTMSYPLRVTRSASGPSHTQDQNHGTVSPNELRSIAGMQTFKRAQRTHLFKFAYNIELCIAALVTGW